MEPTHALLSNQDLRARNFISGSTSGNSKVKHQHHWALSSIPKVPCKLCESVLGCLSERILIDVRMDPALRREPVLDSAGTAAACFQPRCGL